jgi:hypothetical protein
MIAQMSRAEIRVFPTVADGLNFLGHIDRTLADVLTACPANAC